MRKSILLLTWLFSVIIAHGQIVDADGLNARKTQMFGLKSWKSIATEIAIHLNLDERRAINYVKVIDLPNNTESQLFEKAKRWANNTFNTSECMVRSIDDSNHSIIVQGFVYNAVEHIPCPLIMYTRRKSRGAFSDRILIRKRFGTSVNVIHLTDIQIYMKSHLPKLLL